MKIQKAGHARFSPSRWILALGMVGLATSLWAQPAPLTIKERAAEADLVFRGVVESLEYALSEPSGQEQRRIPHTFVTYRVLEVLRGEAPGDWVTLRFIGGLSAMSGRFMTTSHSPRIDVGDEDVLFVVGNTHRIVPLVGSQAGRFRVIGGQVYSEMGESVHLDRRGGIKYGPQYRLEEVATTKFGKEVMTVPYGSRTSELPSNAVWADDFLNLVRRIVPKTATVGTFVNADPRQPFAGPNLYPSPPPAPKPGELDFQPKETKEIEQ